jgi:hypothetical protein
MSKATKKIYSFFSSLPINEDEREEISFILEYNKNRREEQL